MRTPLLLVAASFALACGSDDAAPRERPPALVRTAPVTAGDLTERWLAVGEVRALQTAELAVGAAGPVAAAPVREGDAVVRGQVLLEVERDPALARLRAAEAASRGAQVERERLARALDRRQKVASGVLAAEELQDAEAALAAQDARLAGLQAAEAEARVALHRHQVAAPFDGVVTERLVDAGDWVTVGQPVLTVVSTGDLEVQVRVPHRVARGLEPGSRVELGADEGAVAAVVPALDPTTRTVLVRLTPGPGAQLVAGDAIDVFLPVEWRGVGVTVPRDALLLDPQRARVLKLDGETVASIDVEVLATADRVALVRAEGLTVGDAVITRGNERVRPGQTVRVEDAQAKAAE